MAFCKNCGSELAEGVQFCANCGTPVTAEPQQTYQDVQPEPMYQQAEPVQATVAGNAPEPKTILIFGIISLAISWIPFFGIGGIVLGAIGMSKSNAYVRAGGVRCGMSVTGRILSRVGLIVSIVMTVFWAIYFIAIASLIGSYSGYHTTIYY